MILPKGRDLRRELEEQEAFRNAERQKAEARAAVVFDSFVDSSPYSIELFAADGTLLKSNKAAERLLGKIPPPGLSLFDERGLKRAGLLEPQLRRVLAGARVETPPFWYDPTEIGLPGSPGHRVRCRTTVFPLFNHEGQVSRIAVVHEDLTELNKLETAPNEARSSVLIPAAHTEEQTEVSLPPGLDPRDIEFARRKTEHALRESEERFRTFVESANGYCVLRMNEEGRILALSPYISELTGINRDAIIIDNSLLFAAVHPDDITKVRESHSQAFKTGELPGDLRFRFVHRSRDMECWVEMRGRACGFVGRRILDCIIIDITNWKNIQARLMEKENAFSGLFDSSNDPFITIDSNWIITAWSLAAEQETRLSRSATVGRRLWEVFPALEKSGLALTFRKALLDKEPQYREVFYDDGREQHAGWYAVSVYPFGAGVLALIRNTTQRKRVEQAWQEAESKLRAVLENQTVGIAYKDSELRYVAANPVACRLLGSGTAIDAVGKTDADLFPAAVTALLGSSDRSVLQKSEPVTIELALGDAKLDSTPWLSVTKHPWRSTGGSLLGVVDILFDITRGARAKQELVRRREYLEKLVREQSATLQAIEEELKRWRG
ncbi:MAG: PAS domain S-box protein [candidate division WOR-3 bacterium]